MEYYLAIKKNKNLTISDSMDGHRGYCAKGSRSVRKRQILRDFTYVWNLKNNINKQTKQKQTHRYREQTDGGWGRGRGWRTG